MSSLPSEELEQVEEAVEPVPIGLPKTMQHFNRQQMAEFVSTTLREWKPKEMPDDTSTEP
jgi:hypothetical protein